MWICISWSHQGKELDNCSVSPRACRPSCLFMCVVPRFSVAGRSVWRLLLSSSGSGKCTLLSLPLNWAYVANDLSPSSTIDLPKVSERASDRLTDWLINQLTDSPIDRLFHDHVPGWLADGSVSIRFCYGLDGLLPRSFSIYSFIRSVYQHFFNQYNENEAGHVRNLTVVTWSDAIPGGAPTGHCLLGKNVFIINNN